ncbi:hypothetical protein ACFOLJ_24150 [Rugamonas sp. CCM 8940]|uniref:hypothetical protein n=1 Tax=Rugamonas sp. CCM 8940 TaxID=2765359 RepID=UPI0018F7708E|nr:hypothetical protein [Rugamonas sp. CCM 8940]MBJ7309198.1 hypothetical protein [Rugamonas sp. CCM 8940]
MKEIYIFLFLLFYFLMKIMPRHIFDGPAGAMGGYVIGRMLGGYIGGGLGGRGGGALGNKFPIRMM